ncbi:hypothetical protein ACA30_13200 [Virgibacillus soli]|nr:hypothetical protein ACA30_13200 [Virgibacillus soli]
MESEMRLCKLDVGILQALYDYRAMSTDQISRMFGMTTGYTYKKLHLLRRRKLVVSQPIRGYVPRQRSQGKYHRISETGITCLKKHGMIVERQAYQLKVDKYHLPFVLLTNDLLVDLEPYGWVLSDSRETKTRFNLNRSDNIQGMLLNRHTLNEYGVYILSRNSSAKNLQKAIREIGDYEQIADYLVFTNGRESFETIVKGLLAEDDGSVVGKRKSIKVLPHGFGRKYLRHFDDETKVLEYAIMELGVGFKEELQGEAVKQDGLATVVWHEGKEKYFVNLLDTDLKKVFNMRQYRKEKYMQDGRHLLVLTQNGFHRELLEEIRHVDYLEVHPREVDEYLERSGECPVLQKTF